MNISSTIITAYKTFMKTLPKSHDAGANLCSLKKKKRLASGNQHKHNYNSVS